MIHVPGVGGMELSWDTLGLAGMGGWGRQRQGVVGRGEVGEGGEVWVSCGVGRVKETGGCGRGQVGVAGSRWVWQEMGVAGDR